MAILFVHGVNTRDPAIPPRVAAYIDRYLGGGAFPDSPHVFYSYWGDLGGRYRLGGISRPRTLFTRQGLEPGTSALATTGDFVDILARLPAEPAQDRTRPSTGYTGGIGSRPTAQTRLAGTGRLEAINYLILAAERQLQDDEQLLTRVVEALSELEDDDVAWTTITEAVDAAAELAALESYLAANIGTADYVAQGSGRMRRFVDAVGEGLQRVAGAPAAALSTGLGELRPLLDGLLEEFVGDVFTYLDGREPEGAADPPPPGFGRPACVWEALSEIAGPIPRTVILDLLDAADATPDSEPLLVLTHSMGGQIVYDIVSYFLPRLAEALQARNCDMPLPKVDLWCATASQVGLFEELSLFLASDPESDVAAPFPHGYLNAWWNVWDRNDMLSYTAEGIFEEVDDEEYSSGRSFVGAHSGYLERPSFFKRLRQKVDAI